MKVRGRVFWHHKEREENRFCFSFLVLRVCNAKHLEHSIYHLCNHSKLIKMKASSLFLSYNVFAA